MLLQPGPLTAEMRGSVGGTTFSRNRFGQIARQRVTPVNPNTARQAAVRATFQFLTDAWNSTLTQLQRDSWNLYGASVVMKNKLGEDIYLTGFNQFIRTNTVQLGNLAGTIADGPTTFTLAEADETIQVAPSEATQLLSLAFDDTMVWCDEDDAFLSIAMSKPVVAGVEYIPGPHRLAGYIDGDSTTPPTSPQTVTAPWTITEGQKVEVVCRILRADGRVSGPFRDQANVAS